MRSLITGSNGLIGSYLLENLLFSGDTVCAISRHSNHSSKFLNRRCQLSIGDISDQKFISSTVAEFKPDRIFHLAAQSLPNASWKNSAAFFRVNIEGTFNLLSAISEYCPKSTLVVACSSAEYATTNKNQRITEESELEPGSIYGVTKVANYYLSRLFYRAKGLRIICARPFFIIGPRKKGDVSSDLARGIVKIERGEGVTLKHGNLEAIRDFLDVNDGVSAFKVLSEFGEPGEVYNICSGNGIKISDLLDQFKALAKCEINTKIDETLFRPIDEAIRIGDPSKLMNLGWSPKTSINETISEILNYWRLNQ